MKAFLNSGRYWVKNKNVKNRCHTLKKNLILQLHKMDRKQRFTLLLQNDPPPKKNNLFFPKD